MRSIGCAWVAIRLSICERIDEVSETAKSSCARSFPGHHLEAFIVASVQACGLARIEVCMFRAGNMRPMARVIRTKTCGTHCSLASVQFKPAKIIIYDAGHCHFNFRCKIVFSHLPFKLRRIKNCDELFGKFVWV